MVDIALDPRQRTLAALRLLAAEYGVPGAFGEVQQAEDWREPALAMACECLAAIAYELGAVRSQPARKSKPA